MDFFRGLISHFLLRERARFTAHLSSRKKWISTPLFAFLILALIVGLNFYLYRSEFKALSDPNDNIFQYALIDEAKNIWKNVINGKLSPFYLLDSVNERWAEGFPLSLYYAHLPQAVMSLIGLISPIGLFKSFVVIRTLMLVTLPIMFFLGARILGFSQIFGLILAFFSQAIITDGLYGIDASSFLWRGWGLSAQLMAIYFLPLAFAFTIDYLQNAKNLGKAIFFNFLVASNHFGIFFLLAFSYPIYIVVRLLGDSIPHFSLHGRARSAAHLPGRSKRVFSSPIRRLIIFLLLTFIFLSYFIIPFFLGGNYRNFSYWDPIWKFNSWGAKQILIWFGNGNLFDFNRFPIITLLLVIGLFLGIISRQKIFRYLSILFIFYFLLFFGRTTWGKIIDLIPGFPEFHLHRIIVMPQIIGLFLAAFMAWKIFEALSSQKLLLIVVALLSIVLLEKPVIQYAKDNDTWIKRDNLIYQKDYSDYQKIVERLKKLPSGRVYAGRPGNWGRDFKVGPTQVYMALSRDGIPVIGFLPESWSPNSDQEQFFNEDDINFYSSYNVSYIVYPLDKKTPIFAKSIQKEGQYTLYQVDSGGWFALGRLGPTIKTKKTDLLLLSRLWFASPLFPQQEYPLIQFSKKTDFSYWQDNPILQPSSTQKPFWQKTQETQLINGYSLNFDLKQDCSSCILLLKESFHPNWQIKINGKKVKTMPIFPFYIGIPISQKGSYQLQAIYQPDSLKKVLIAFEILFSIFLILRLLHKKFLKTSF